MQDRAVLRMKAGLRNLDISLPSVILYLYLCRTPFLRFAQAFDLSTRLVAGVFVVSWAALLLFYSLQDIHNICWDGIALVLAAYLFFVITIRIHPEYQIYYDDPYNQGEFGMSAVFSIGCGLHAYYHIRLFKNRSDELYRVFRVIAHTVFFTNIWTFFFNRGLSYNMEFGYLMELAAVLYIGQYLYERRRKLELVLSLFAMMFVALYGARASLIGYVVCIAAYFVWQRQMTWRKACILLLGLLAVIVLRSHFLLNLIYRMFTSMGIESRTLKYLALGDLLAVDSARQDSIWPALSEVVRNSSLFKMYGAYGDRQFNPLRAAYAHNFILEILLDFGKFFGGLFLLWLAFKLFFVCKNNKNTNGLLIIMFASYSLSRLFFSSSFWYEPYFWGLIALLINYARPSGKVRWIGRNAQWRRGLSRQ